MWTSKERKKKKDCPRGKINLRFQGGCRDLYRSLHPHCAYLLSGALVCCRMRMEAAGLTGALPLLAWMPALREHLDYLMLWESYLVLNGGLSPWNFVPLSCYCFWFCLFIYFAERDLQSLNITLLSPASIEDFLYGSYQLSYLGDSGISANITGEKRIVVGIVAPMLRKQLLHSRVLRVNAMGDLNSENIYFGKKGEGQPVSTLYHA